VKATRIKPQFVDMIPQTLETGVIYVSIEYGTTAHLCCCGCGYEVTLPLTPTDWSVTYDGESVSLAPSVGNSSFPCRSHYWIRRGRVDWYPAMTAKQTQRARRLDRQAKAAAAHIDVPSSVQHDHGLAPVPVPSRPWWRRLRAGNDRP